MSAPRKRASYLLHDIFDVAYPGIARMLDLQEARARNRSCAAATSCRATATMSPPWFPSPRMRREQARQIFILRNPDKLADWSIAGAELR